MIVFIELVKRVSILHENFFIYKKQLTSQYFTELQNISTQSTPTKQLNTYSPTKQYKPTIQTTKQTS